MLSLVHRRGAEFHDEVGGRGRTGRREAYQRRGDGEDGRGSRTDCVDAFPPRPDCAKCAHCSHPDGFTPMMSHANYIIMPRVSYAAPWLRHELVDYNGPAALAKRRFAARRRNGIAWPL